MGVQNVIFVPLPNTNEKEKALGGAGTRFRAYLKVQIPFVVPLRLVTFETAGLPLTVP